MENLRKRINVRLINNAKYYKKLCKQTKFYFTKRSRENFVAIYVIKPVLTLNKPIYVECCILDCSKLLMYEFYCNCIKTKCNANLSFRDTNSLVYEIKTNDLCEYFYKDKDLLDFSDYPKDSVF